VAVKNGKASVGASKDFIVQNGMLRPRKISSSARASRASSAHNSNMASTFDAVSNSHPNLKHFNAKKGSQNNTIFIHPALSPTNANLTPRIIKRNNTSTRNGTETHSSLIEKQQLPKINNHSFSFAKPMVSSKCMNNNRIHL